VFKIADAKPEMAEWGTPCFLAWTTTPWTLPSNTALCVGPKIEYVLVNTYNPYTAEKLSVIIAKARLNAYLKAEGAELPMDEYKPGDKVVPYRIVAEYTGEQLIGMKYNQLMPWVKPCEKLGENAAEFVKNYAGANPDKVFTVGKDKFVELESEAFRVIGGDYVTTEDGTGIVHIAPTFGADDARVAKAAGIPSLFMINIKGETRPMVDLTGKYYTLDECAPEFVEHCVDVALYEHHAGDYVKNAYDPKFNVDGKYDDKAAEKAEDLNIVIALEMKQAGEAFKIEKHVHNYPHCWRTDKPVLYYPLDSWFIRTTAAREKLIANNETIKWKPQSTGSGRFGKWLENLQDWNLSRSRYWGTPLPVWRTEDGLEEICIDSVETLVEAGIMKSNPYKDKGFVPGDYSKENYDKIDLHRPYVDDIILVSSTGKPMRRELDLIDVWFDSGAMPYAQIHYPFENKEAFDSGELYPADFIAEGVDQTRGWFFTLHAIAGMVFDSVAYKAVVSNGLVLDRFGNKMSKRLGNAVNPFEAIDEFGSDPLRWYMIANSSPWDNLKYDPEGVKETSRKLFGTLYNTYSFFALYANVDGFDNSQPQVPVAERPEIDRWILSLLNTLIRDVEDALDDYEPTKAARAINDFVNDNLSNWYVRLNRKRFWGGEMDKDKLSAYQTLYTCLETVALLMAPISPFFADRLYTDLTSVTKGTNTSVHLALFPVAGESDKSLEERMKLAQDITSMVLALRRKVNIKVRQPLSTLMVPVLDDAQKAKIESMADLILSEVNVKSIKFVGNDEGVLVKRVKPDFKKLGPKYGKIMKAIAAEVGKMSQHDIAELERNGAFTFNIDGTAAEVQLGDVEIISEDIPGWQVANDGSLTVALDVTFTDDLKKEGIARDIVNRVQNIRKGRDYDIVDKITLTFAPNEAVDEAINTYSDYIARQVLATSVVIAPLADDAVVETLDLDGVEVKAVIELSK
jgi:isoleucyl-tRNA synthetase